jgi:NMD protein affecting ribosome stability and mRNA decay
MLCIDCLVKDRKENKAITVTNGYALCRSCLFVFYSKMHRANEEAMKDLKVFLDHEASMEGVSDNDDRADSSNV